MLSLDLAGLVAGSGIRGQFEEKFKGLLKEIEAEVSEFNQHTLQIFNNVKREEMLYALSTSFVRHCFCIVNFS